MDFYQFIAQVLPSLLRRNRQLAWLRSLVAPLQTLWGDTVFFRIFDWRNRANRNSQVLIFEDYLNDLFDSGLRRIKIIHEEYEVQAIYFRSEAQADTFISYRNEGAPDYFVFFRSEKKITGTEDFIVQVPASLQATSEQQIIAAIERYRITARTYRIEWI